MNIIVFFLQMKLVPCDSEEHLLQPLELRKGFTVVKKGEISTSYFLCYSKGKTDCYNIRSTHFGYRWNIHFKITWNYFAREYI
jgi:hypothetical protein